MKMTDNMEKRDVKVQLFITSSVDDQLCDIAAIMGMNRNELIRVAIGNYLAGWQKSVEFARDLMDDVKIDYIENQLKK